MSRRASCVKLFLAKETMERLTFKNGELRDKPTEETVIVVMFCFALHLSYGESEDLVKLSR